MGKKTTRQIRREVDEFIARGDNPGHRGRRNPGSWRGSEVQSLLFDAARWTPGEAKKWAIAHDFRAGKVHETENYVRLRQFEPVPGAQKRTITFGDGIKAVIEQVR